MCFIQSAFKKSAPKVILLLSNLCNKKLASHEWHNLASDQCVNGLSKWIAWKDNCLSDFYIMNMWFPFSRERKKQNKAIFSFEKKKIFSQFKYLHTKENNMDPISGLTWTCPAILTKHSILHTEFEILFFLSQKSPLNAQIIL